MATSSRPALNILIPVYNEGDNFPTLYKEIDSKIKIPFKAIVVYDMDEDTTVPVVKALKDKRFELYKNNRGRGVLNAILSGFDYVKSGPVLVTMADVSDDLTSVNAMYEAYLKGAKVCCGSRYMKGGKQIGGPLLKRTLSHFAGTSLFWLRRFPTHDVTNNFKLYDKSFLDSIKIESKDGFEIAMEITVKAYRLNAVITEVPTTWKDREAGKSNFKLFKWLPSYIRWYLYAFAPKRS